MNEILFIIEDVDEGGYIAHAFYILNRLILKAICYGK